MTISSLQTNHLYMRPTRMQSRIWKNVGSTETAYDGHSLWTSHASKYIFAFL